MNNFKEANDSVFLYSNGIKTEEKFNDMMKFETFVLEYKGSIDWVEEKIFEMKKVLDQDFTPALNEDCDTCSHVVSRNQFLDN